VIQFSSAVSFVSVSGVCDMSHSCELHSTFICVWHDSLQWICEFGSAVVPTRVFVCVCWCVFVRVCM